MPLAALFEPHLSRSISGLPSHDSMINVGGSEASEETGGAAIFAKSNRFRWKYQGPRPSSSIQSQMGIVGKSHVGYTASAL